MEWTEEAIAKLRTLWAEGLSTAEIGRRLNISKNAVVGKAHRLNLPPRPSPIRRTEGQTAARAECAQARPGPDLAAALRLDRQPRAELAGDHAGAEIQPARHTVLLADRRAGQVQLPFLQCRRGNRQTLLRRACGDRLCPRAGQTGRRRLRQQERLLFVNKK